MVTDPAIIEGATGSLILHVIFCLLVVIVAITSIFCIKSAIDMMPIPYIG